MRAVCRIARSRRAVNLKSSKGSKKCRKAGWWLFYVIGRAGEAEPGDQRKGATQNASNTPQADTSELTKKLSVVEEEVTRPDF